MDYSSTKTIAACISSGAFCLLLGLAIGRAGINSPSYLSIASTDYDLILKAMETADSNGDCVQLTPLPSKGEGLPSVYWLKSCR